MHPYPINRKENVTFEPTFFGFRKRFESRGTEVVHAAASSICSSKYHQQHAPVVNVSYFASYGEKGGGRGRGRGDRTVARVVHNLVQETFLPRPAFEPPASAAARRRAAQITARG